MGPHFPKRIVCLTEESVEVLFHIGMGHLVVGVSAYVERPTEAKKLPVVCAFTGGSVKKVRDLKADLVLGFSDIQKDFARDLIGEGQSVYIANHRSISGIITYVNTLGFMVGALKETALLVQKLEAQILKAQNFSKTLKVRPKVYIEEWDEPMICGIQWFSEIVELCGGINITKEKSESGGLARERFVNVEEVVEANPDIILACWCGKKVDIKSIKEREGFGHVKAVQNDWVLELDPAIFLQPGPAPILAGIDIIIDLLTEFDSK